MARSGPDTGPDRRHLASRPFHDRRRLRIGLFGGSFNPAHEGHLHLSDLARRALRLDEIWWLVSPQNPLKTVCGMASLPARLCGARRITRKRRHVRVIAPEAEFRSALTANTLLTLRKRCPRHRFIWLMGADNMASFNSWQRHNVIAGSMPIAVIDRPGYSYLAMSMGDSLLDRRVPPGRMAANLRGSGHLGRQWCFIAGRRHHASATALRQTGQQGANVERDD